MKSCLFSEIAMTQQDFIDRFEYQSGKLFYKKREGCMKKGSEVGTKNADGYIKTLINRKPYLAHRIIFMMHHGYLPKYLDHIDGNPGNNKIENLRPVTYSQNNLNRGKQKRNTSGFKGVTWVKTENRYSARIAINGKRLFLGYFDDPKKAHEAYCEAAKEYEPNFVRTQ
jgi:hypothetical protein